MTTFKLVPYKFRMYKRGIKSENVPFSNFDNNGTDFSKFLYDKIKEDKVEHVYDEPQRTISVSKVFNSQRIISGIVEYGEYGIEASFTDVDTKNEVLGIKRRTNYSEKYPFFFLIYIPENGNNGTLILQNYKNIGIKSVFEKILQEYIDNLGLELQVNHIISRDLMEQINNSRLVEFKMIRYDVPKDVAECFNPDSPKNIHEVRSIIARRNKEINVVQAIKDKLSGNDTQYYEILGEKYDEVKVLIEVGKSKKTLTFNNKGDQYMESMQLKDIQLQGGFPVYADLYDNAKTYLEHLVEKTGV